MKKINLILMTVVSFSSYSQQDTLKARVVVERSNEVLFHLEDSGGDYTGFWTMNDGMGNMAIKLGIGGDGRHVVSNDGASEVMWGAHGTDGYISLNAAKRGTKGDLVSYDMSLIVDAEDNAIKVSTPNNSTGGTGTGNKIANSDGDLFTDQLINRTSAGLDIDLGSGDGDLFIYDENNAKYTLGQNGNAEGGIVLKAAANPANGTLLFAVQSGGGSERLRVEHNGATSTTNVLQVKNTGLSYVQGSLAVNGTSVPAGYDFSVDGKAIMEEVKVEIFNGPDYVFESDYNLRTLAETEQYIQANKHLPEIPSAKEMEANGVELGVMNMLLLKKIEELTLYVLELKKENEDQQEEINSIKSNKKK